MITTLPTLPTDSLYKFTFYLGLLLLFGSFFFMFKQNEAVMKYHLMQDSLVLNESASLKHERFKDSVLIKELSKTNNAFDRLKKFRPQTNQNADSLKDEITVKTTDERIKLYKDYLESDSIHKLYDFKFAYIAKQIKHKTEFSGYIFQACLMFTGSLLLMWSGFMWYYRIQIPQDELFNLQVITAKKEAEAKKFNSGRKHFEPRIYPQSRL
jgi:hypothetical protein